MGLTGLYMKDTYVGKLSLSLGISLPGRGSPVSPQMQHQENRVDIIDSEMNGCQIDNKESKKTQNSA